MDARLGIYCNIVILAFFLHECVFLPINMVLTLVGFFCLAAYFNDIAVGAVCCRVDHSQNQKRLYIMTLGCLAPYRRLGIGKKIHSCVNTVVTHFGFLYHFCKFEFMILY